MYSRIYAGEENNTYQMATSDTVCNEYHRILCYWEFREAGLLSTLLRQVTKAVLAAFGKPRWYFITELTWQRSSI